MVEGRQVFKRFLALTLVLAMVLALLPDLKLEVKAASSGEVTGLSNENIGLSYSGDKDDTWSANGTTITGSIQSSSGCWTTHYSSTLTITNKRSIAAVLSFDYAIDPQKGTIQVDGTVVTAGGTFSKKLEAGGTVNVYVKSNSTSAPTKITLSNIALSADIEATVTFLTSEHGSYTVNGKTVTEEYPNTQNAMNAYKLAATPDAGYQFKGWYDYVSETYIGTDAQMSFNAEKDATLTALFVPETVGLFETGGQVFENLPDAIAYAQEKGIEKVSLQSKRATLTEDITIPEGITLLVPFDAEKTLFKETPTALVPGHQAAVKRNEFRSLTLAQSVTLTVEGSVSVGGRYQSASGGSNSYISGDYGQIWLSDKSSEIVVENGGNLYAWGFISGAGSVTAKSGATVYEWYQILDFRGGTATMGIGNKVFPFSQYDVQNIESALTLEQGATETVYAAVYASSRINPSAIPFIGDNGMFKIVSGRLTKVYDGTTDRIIYTVDGEAEVNNLNLKLAGSSVSSKNYVLPLTNNMTINLIESSKLTVNQTAALLPGVQANIAKGANLVISKGNSIYVYDQDEWGGYCDTYSLKFKAVGYAPSKTYQRTEEKDLLDAKVNVNGTLTVNGDIYTTESGADICSSEGTGIFQQGSAPGTETVTYQYTQSGSSVTAHEIPITPAKLHNADGSYAETAGVSAGDNINYIDGKWNVPTKSYKIEFNANGGSGSMDEQQADNGTDVTLSANTFIREGYKFTGWNTQADGQGTSYEDGASISITENVTLYAQWECLHGKTEVRDAKGASCKETGYTGDTYCTVCNEKIKTGESIPAKGHTWDEGKITAAPTCENAGVRTFTCTVCKETKTEAIDATGHTPVEVAEQPATCTEPGHAAGTKCSVCDAILSGLEEIPAAGHTEVVDPAVDATCTEPGKTEGKHCSVCNGVLVAQTVVPAKGHTEEIRNEKEATLTEAGYTGDTYCSVCNELLEKGKEIPKTGVVITWIVDGKETEKVYAKGTMPVFEGSTDKEPDENYRYTFAGWEPEVKEATEDAAYRATYEKTERIFRQIRFDANGGEGTMDPQTLENGIDTQLKSCGFTRKDCEFTGWNTEADGSGTSYVAGGALRELKGDLTLYAQWKHKDGWFRDAQGKQYYTDGELQKTGWTDIGENTYYLDETTGYAAEDGVYWLPYPEGYGPDQWDLVNNKDYATNGHDKNSYFLFDKEGVFQADKNGMYELTADTKVVGGKAEALGEARIVWIVMGELPWHPGMVTVDGAYFYFTTGYFEKGKSFVADTDYYVSKTNDLQWPDTVGWGEGSFVQGTYSFDAGGKLCLRDGFVELAKDPTAKATYYYVKGVKTYAGLIQIDGDYYYVKSDCEVVRDRSYYVSKTNGLLPAGTYVFDRDGKLKMEDPAKNGIVKEENDVWYYYVNGVKVYAGLIQIDGDYYYVNSKFEVIHGRNYFISKTNGLLEQRTYSFDADGKLQMPETEKNGIVKGTTENDPWYYYENGVKVYAGLIQIDGAYYYVKSDCQVVRDRDYVISKTNGLKPAGSYHFGADGKMEVPEEGINGIVKNGDTWYYYVDGVKTYAGLIQIDGDYYYVNSQFQVIHGRDYFVSKNNGLLESGTYTFDADGKLKL